MNIAQLECYSCQGCRIVARIGLRLRKNLRYGSTRSGVQPEVVSTIQEPIPSCRRLVYLPDVVGVQNPQDSIESTQLQSIVISREGVPHPRAMLNYSSAIIDRSKWRIIAAHPTSEWFAAEKRMQLPLGPYPSLGAVVLESRKKLGFTLLLGRIGSSLSPLWEYWIFPGPPKCYDPANFDHLTGSRSAENLYGLQWLCEQARSFVRKYFFENVSRRLEARKFVLLPNGDILRISISNPRPDNEGHWGGIHPVTTYRLVIEPGAGIANLTLPEFAPFTPIPWHEQGDLLPAGANVYIHHFRYALHQFRALQLCFRRLFYLSGDTYLML